MSSLYLLKRGATYYFRRAIPADLRTSFAGASEFIHSLRTKDREEAKRLRSLAAAKTDELLEGARIQLSGATNPDPKPSLAAKAGGERAEPRWSRPSVRARDFSEWQSLIDLWATVRKPAPKTIAMHASNARSFFAFCPKSLRSVTEGDVDAFLNDLLKNGATQTNTNTILSKLKTLFSFAKTKKIITSNPARDLKVDVKDRQPRKPFDHSDLEVIFSQSVFTKGDRPQGLGEATFWIPLLALCEGTREEELAQLRLQDIVVRSFYWKGKRHSWPFLSLVRDEQDGLRIKTDSSVRDVPIHPFILRLGFLDYVNSLRDRHEKWLFPELKRGPFGCRSTYFGKWFGSFLRGECQILDPCKVFYSFRHTFKDLARDSDIPDSLQRQLMGHGKRDVADGYGDGYGDYKLVEAIKKLCVPGICILGVASDSTGDHCYSWERQT